MDSVSAPVAVRNIWPGHTGPTGARPVSSTSSDSPLKALIYYASVYTDPISTKVRPLQSVLTLKISYEFVDNFAGYQQNSYISPHPVMVTVHLKFPAPHRRPS